MKHFEIRISIYEFLNLSHFSAFQVVGTLLLCHVILPMGKSIFALKKNFFFAFLELNQMRKSEW